jgi:hypothetical protein
VISFNFDQDITDPSCSRVTTWKRRFFRYLPLYRNSDYITGLTIYQNRQRIVGLEAYFLYISQLSGCCSGCLLYFPLGPKEQIVYCWLCVVNYDPVFYRLALVVSSRYICHLLPLTCCLDSNDIWKISYLWIIHSATAGHRQPI